MKRISMRPEKFFGWLEKVLNRFEYLAEGIADDSGECYKIWNLADNRLGFFEEGLNSFENVSKGFEMGLSGFNMFLGRFKILFGRFLINFYDILADNEVFVGL